jgi:hypothetical protein
MHRAGKRQRISHPSNQLKMVQTPRRWYQVLSKSMPFITGLSYRLSATLEATTTRERKTTTGLRSWAWLPLGSRTPSMLDTSPSFHSKQKQIFRIEWIWLSTMGIVGANMLLLNTLRTRWLALSRRGLTSKLTILPRAMLGRLKEDLSKTRGPSLLAARCKCAILSLGQ